MDSLLIAAKQQQLDSTRQQLWKLVEFSTDAPCATLAFTPAQLATKAGVLALSQQLPAATKAQPAAKCLYYLETDDAAAVLADFEAYKAALQASSSPRANPHAVSRRHAHAQGNCLYVGSSTLATFAARFKRHCGYYGGQDRTFGLKLGRWLHAPGVTLTLHYWLFEALDQQVLQLLEDGLWQHQQPLFGRKGGAR